MQKIGKIMASINFNLFFRSKDVNLETLAAREQALRDGAVLEHRGKRYHVQILCTSGEGGTPSKLFFRIYTKSRHEIRCFKAGNKGKALFAGDKNSENAAIFRTKTFYNLITKGTIIENPEALIFTGELNVEEQAFCETHLQPMPKEDEVIEMEPDHIEDAPVDPKWTRNQKGSALMIAVIATIAIGYGTKAAAKQWNLKAPNMPQFPNLEELKASLERLNIYRKDAVLGKDSVN
jgi:hypothetical protein